MPQFITKIQLQDANEQDYAKLDEELKKELFINEKDTSKGNAHIDGQEVFSKAGNITLEDVQKSLFRAATKTGKRYSFFIVKSKNIIQHNLVAQ